MSLAHCDAECDSAVWVEAVDSLKNENVRIMYSHTKIVGNGVFGVVYYAKLNGKHDVAIKKVLQDKKYINRELEIIRSLCHPNIVLLFYYFYTISSSSKSDGAYLSLVQEYVPENLGRLIRSYWKNRKQIPLSLVKIFSFQLLRGLAYLHNFSICHRDIKPQNILIDPKKGILKICDFGSAKKLSHKEPNVSYICSRHYRAPELIFGAVNYTTSIDIWSAGCVVGELLLGRVLFPGDSGIDQLVEIMKILGTPDEFQMREMNPNYSKYKFPFIKGCSWEKHIKHRNNEACFDLLKGMLVYAPCVRLTAAEALSLTFFTDLLDFPKGCPLDATGYLPNGQSAPHLLANFTEQEMSYLPVELVTRIKAYLAYQSQRNDRTSVNTFSSCEKTKKDEKIAHSGCIHERTMSYVDNRPMENMESRLPILKSHVCREAVTDVTKRRSILYSIDYEDPDGEDKSLSESKTHVTLRKTKNLNSQLRNHSYNVNSESIIGHRPVSMTTSYHSSVFSRKSNYENTNNFDEEEESSRNLFIVGSNSSSSFRRPRRNTLLSCAFNNSKRKNTISSQPKDSLTTDDAKVTSTIEK